MVNGLVNSKKSRTFAKILIMNKKNKDIIIDISFIIVTIIMILFIVGRYSVICNTPYSYSDRPYISRNPQADTVPPNVVQDAREPQADTAYPPPTNAQEHHVAREPHEDKTSHSPNTMQSEQNMEQSPQELRPISSYEDTIEQMKEKERQLYKEMKYIEYELKRCDFKNSELLRRYKWLKTRHERLLKELHERDIEQGTSQNPDTIQSEHKMEQSVQEWFPISSNEKTIEQIKKEERQLYEEMKFLEYRMRANPTSNINRNRELLKRYNSLKYRHEELLREMRERNIEQGTSQNVALYDSAGYWKETGLLIESYENNKRVHLVQTSDGYYELVKSDIESYRWMTRRLYKKRYRLYVK